MKSKFYSNGKLLITGEYLVLDGADALAVPTVYGQSLTVKPADSKLLLWKSKDKDKNIWLKASYKLKQGHLFLVSEGCNEAKTLHNILLEARKLNPDFLKHAKGFQISTKLNFDRHWGLGTSSTLINNIAQWAKIDAFALLQNSFGGSGYDIACAQNDVPVVFSNKDGKLSVKQTLLNWNFTDHIFFVYLNKKQDSRQAIAGYNAVSKEKKNAVSEVSRLTEAFVNCSSLNEFETLIEKHETLISQILGISPIKQKLFPDFKGAVKSLGAWGGDFIMATGNRQNMDYFSERGYTTIIPFEEMVKRKSS